MPAESAPSFVFVPDLPEVGAEVRLSPDESHYLVRVCRVRAGDRVRATDGRGGLATLRLEGVRDQATGVVEALDRQTRDHEVWVCVGAPEGQRADWLIEKLAELGVAVWQPVDCARASWTGSTGRAERWGRLAIAALRQSRRRFGMDVRAPIALSDLPAALPPDARRWLADPAGEVGGEKAERSGVDVGVIGPAQGFDPEERSALGSAGFRAVALSEARLRTETAALVWAARWCHL